MKTIRKITPICLSMAVMLGSAIPSFAAPEMVPSQVPGILAPSIVDNSDEQSPPVDAGIKFMTNGDFGYDDIEVSLGYTQIKDSGIDFKTFYADSFRIKDLYREAVDVFTSLSIVNGMEDSGSIVFNPTGNYTREQAAKIITYLVLGPEEAEKLEPEASFNDVDISRWSSKYIAFCNSRGIILGYGDGRFGPTDSLTDTQWEAILLRATGHGKNGEYSGANWAENVEHDANIYHIPGAAEYLQDSDSIISRERAVYYAFRAATRIPVIEDKEDGAGGIQGNSDTLNFRNTLAWKSYHLVDLSSLAYKEGDQVLVDGSIDEVDEYGIIKIDDITFESHQLFSTTFKPSREINDKLIEQPGVIWVTFGNSGEDMTQVSHYYDANEQIIIF